MLAKSGSSLLVQRLVRRCSYAKLGSVDEFEAVAEVKSGEQVRELIRAQPIDVVLMDLNMPGIGELEAR